MPLWQNQFWMGVLKIIFFLLISANLSAEVYYTREEALKEVFPDASKIEEKTLSLSKEQKEKVRILLGTSKVYSDFTYNEAVKDNQIIGYAVISDAMGKRMHFTYMVAVNPNGSIEMVKILEYKELFGRRIKEEGFLNKFREKTIKSPLRINVDIDNVTGATISSMALTKGVKETLIYLNVLVLVQKK